MRRLKLKRYRVRLKSVHQGREEEYIYNTGVKTKDPDQTA